MGMFKKLAINNKKEIVRNAMIETLDKLKKVNPDQRLIVETPNGSVNLKIGDALIYEDGYGTIVIDSE